MLTIFDKFTYNDVCRLRVYANGLLTNRIRMGIDFRMLDKPKWLISTLEDSPRPILESLEYPEVLVYPGFTNAPYLEGNDPLYADKSIGLDYHTTPFVELEVFKANY